MMKYLQMKKGNIYAAAVIVLFVVLMALWSGNKSEQSVIDSAYEDSLGVYVTDVIPLLPGNYDISFNYSAPADTFIDLHTDYSEDAYRMELSSEETRVSFPLYLGKEYSGIYFTYPEGSLLQSPQLINIDSPEPLNNNTLAYALLFLAVAVFVWYMVLSRDDAWALSSKKKYLLITGILAATAAVLFVMLYPGAGVLMKALRFTSRKAFLSAVLSVEILLIFLVPLANSIIAWTRGFDELISNDRKAQFAVFFLMCCLFLFSRLYKLDVILPGIHVDEIGAGYDALSIKDYGVDRWTVRYPVYFQNYGTGQNALYTYLAAILFCFVDFSVYALRIPAVLFGFFGFIAAYILSGKLFEEYRYRLLTLILYTVCPFFFMSERWGLESYLLCSLVFVSMTCLYYAVETGRGRWYLLTGLAFGITLYTYAITYILEPLFLLFALFYLIFLKKVSVKNIVLCAVPFVLLAAPLALEQLINAGYIGAIHTPFNDFIPMTEFRGEEFSLSHFMDNLRISHRLLTADDRPYNGNARFGTMFYISIPFMAAGLIDCAAASVRSFKEKEYDYRVFVIVFFIISYLESLTVEMLNINRSNEIYFCFLIFTIYGMSMLGKKRKLLLYALIPVYVLCFYFFTGYYYSSNGLTMDMAQSKEHCTLLQPTEMGLAARAVTGKYGDSKELYVVDLVDEFQELVLAAYEGVSPYEFHEDSLNNSIYKTGIPDELDLTGHTAYVIKEEYAETADALREAGFDIDDESYDGIIVAVKE